MHIKESFGQRLYTGQSEAELHERDLYGSLHVPVPAILYVILCFVTTPFQSQNLLYYPKTLLSTQIKLRPTHRPQPNSPPPLSHREIWHAIFQYQCNNLRTPPAHPIPLIQTQFPTVRKLFSDALEDQAAKVGSAIKTLKTTFEKGSISTPQYAEKANTILVSALQATADS